MVTANRTATPRLANARSSLDNTRDDPEPVEGSGQVGDGLSARTAPTTPSATNATPSVSADGLVTAPELPMMAAPAACVDACRIPSSATGTITIAAPTRR